LTRAWISVAVLRELDGSDGLFPIPKSTVPTRCSASDRSSYMTRMKSMGGPVIITGLMPWGRICPGCMRMLAVLSETGFSAWNRGRLANSRKSMSPFLSLARLASLAARISATPRAE